MVQLLIVDWILILLYHRITKLKPSTRNSLTPPRWCQLNSPLPWPRIYAGLSTNWEAEIAWRIAHGVLNSRQSFLLSLGISDQCAVCRNTETFSHAFCKFSLVPTVWNWVLTHTNKLYLLNAPSLPLKHGLTTGPQQVGSDALITRFPFILR